MTLMLIMSFMLTIMFPWLNHPLSMGATLIMQTLMVAIISGMMMNSFWFSYILMIIMLGGALVLFIYMASIASNEKFKMSYFMIMSSTLIFLFMIMFIKVDEMFINKINFINNNKIIENEQLITLLKLFNMQSTSLTIMLVTYLFLTMIAVSNIVTTYEGPMRSKS